MEKLVSMKRNIILLSSFLNLLISFVLVFYITESVGIGYIDAGEGTFYRGFMVFILSFAFLPQLILGVLIDKKIININFTIFGLIFMAIGVIIKPLSILSTVLVGTGYAIVISIIGEKVCKLNTKNSLNWGLFVASTFLSIIISGILHNKFARWRRGSLTFTGDAIIISVIVSIILLILSFLIIKYFDKLYNKYREQVKLLSNQEGVRIIKVDKNTNIGIVAAIYFVISIIFFMFLISLRICLYQLIGVFNGPMWNEILCLFLILIAAYFGFVIMQKCKNHLISYQIIASFIAFLAPFILMGILDGVFPSSAGILSDIIKYIVYCVSLLCYGILLLIPIDYIFKMFKHRKGFAIGLINLSIYLGLTISWYNIQDGTNGSFTLDDYFTFVLVGNLIVAACIILGIVFNFLFGKTRDDRPANTDVKEKITIGDDS